VPWFKADDKLHSHAKAVAAIRECRSALALWVVAGSWCADQLTDGNVPEAIVDRLGFGAAEADALVSARLWHRTESGYVFHGWTDYQPTRRYVLAKRKAARKRMVALRSGSQHVRANKQRSSREVRVMFATPDPVPIPSRPVADAEERGAVLAPLTPPAAPGHEPVDAATASRAWHRCAERAAPGTLHALTHWRQDFGLIAAACNGVRGRPAMALDAVCRWFWLADDGPVRAKRLRRPEPRHLAKRITGDLDRAWEWHCARSKAAE
jgi:hypothetical protein